MNVAAEQSLAPDRAAILVSRDTMPRQAARQVKAVVLWQGFRMASSFPCRFLMSLGVLAVVVLPALTRLPAGEKDSAKVNVDDEAKKLQGHWKQVRMVLDGDETKREIASQFTYRFEGWRFNNSRSGKTISEGTFTIDPVKKLPEMNFVEKDGTKLFAVYSLMGDVLTICFHEEVRPTALESKKGQRRLIVVLERGKQ